jgi:cell division protein ZapA
MTQVLDVTLMGRSYRVSCEPGEREALMSAVEYVDAKMRELAGRSRIGGERLLAMAALNIAHDLILSQQVEGVDVVQAKRRVAVLSEQIGIMLARQSGAGAAVEAGQPHQ